MKKLTAILLVLLAMLLACSVVMAEPLTYEQFSYELRDDGVAITGYALPENPTAIQIPAAIEGKPVVEIAGRAFTNSEIKTISIPVSVKRIAGNAFYGCSKDLNLLVPGNHPVFATIEGDLYEKTTRTLVVGLGPELKVPTGIQAIGEYACYGQHFTSISLPETVKNIGAHAFQDATAPAFPLVEGVVSIEESAFRFFRATDDNLTLPSTVRTVGEEAFYKTYLSALTFNKGLEVLGDGAFSNAIFKVGETRSSAYNHGSKCVEANSGEAYVDVNIPAGVKLGEGVFSELNTLAKRGNYRCKCDDYDRQLADIAVEMQEALLGHSVEDGVKTTVTGVVRFHYTLGADATVPAKLFEVTKKTKLSGDTMKDAYAELSTTSATILPKVQVVVDAPQNAELVIDARAFDRCSQVTFAQPVILKEVGSRGFASNQINGDVTLDAAMTTWPFVYCTFETWTGIPEHITTLGHEACSAMTLTDEYLHAGLVEIAPDAFTSDSTFVVEAGSYAEMWAMENNRLFTYAAGGDDLGWLTGDSGADDLSWLNPEGDAKYNEAKALEEAGDLAGAIALYEQVGDHRDAPERIETLKLEMAYQAALDLEAQEDYIGATNGYKALGDYKDCVQRVEELEIKCVYQKAKVLMDEGKFSECQELVEPYAQTDPEAEKLLFEALFRVNGMKGTMSPEGTGWVRYYVEETEKKGGTVYHKVLVNKTALVDVQGNVLMVLDSGNVGDWGEGFWVVETLNTNRSAWHYVYLNAQGQNVFGQEFKKAETFHQGKALVTTLDDRKVVIDTTGQKVAELPVKEGRFYQSYLGEGLVSFKDDMKDNVDWLWGVCDLNGKVVVKAKYQQYKSQGVERFQYGLAMVKDLRNWKVSEGVINAKGKEVVKLGKIKYSSSNKIGYIGILAENMIALDTDGKGDIITNLKNKKLTKTVYGAAARKGDLIVVQKKGGGKYGYGALDLELNEVIPMEYDYIEVGYQSQWLVLRKDGKKSIYNRNDLSKPYQDVSDYIDLKISPDCPYILGETEDKGWVILDCEGNIIF